MLHEMTDMMASMRARIEATRRVTRDCTRELNELDDVSRRMVRDSMEMAESFAESDRLEPAVEALLRAESWDTLTVNVIMKKLEQNEGLDEGSLKPQKAKIKEAVDAMMKKVLAKEGHTLSVFWNPGA